MQAGLGVLGRDFYYSTEWTKLGGCRFAWETLWSSKASSSDNKIMSKPFIEQRERRRSSESVSGKIHYFSLLTMINGCQWTHWDQASLKWILLVWLERAADRLLSSYQYRWDSQWEIAVLRDQGCVSLCVSMYLWMAEDTQENKPGEQAHRRKNGWNPGDKEA